MVEQTSESAQRDLLLSAMADILRAHGARDVYVFGSTARRTRRADSDWDLAVTGLPPERFFAALAQVTLASPAAVDLVDLDEDSPFVRHLRSKGSLERVG